MPCRTTKQVQQLLTAPWTGLLVECDRDAQAGALQVTSNTTVRLKIAFRDMGWKESGHVRKQPWHLRPDAAPNSQTGWAPKLEVRIAPCWATRHLPASAVQLWPDQADRCG